MKTKADKMENAEEILQCLDEFSKVRPKDIPRELEEYLCFVAKTGDPIYQWPVIKCLFREKLINVITEFYETCPSVEIPPCPNVDAFNYDTMKSFILEKLDTFAAAPFTVQRICELLTTPRKEYNRIDKYMRALEKNMLVVSTKEPGSRRNAAENGGDSVVNGMVESEQQQQHVVSPQEMMGSTAAGGAGDINVEVEMDDSSVYAIQEPSGMDVGSHASKVQDMFMSVESSATAAAAAKETEAAAAPMCSGSPLESVITQQQPVNYMNYSQNASADTDSMSGESIGTEAREMAEKRTVLSAPGNNITVTITNVSDEEIGQLTTTAAAAATTEEQQEAAAAATAASEAARATSQPIYLSQVSTANKEAASVYLGTNEHGDQVYKIRYEPFPDIDYMSLPESTFLPPAQESSASYETGSQQQQQDSGGRETKAGAEAAAGRRHSGGDARSPRDGDEPLAIGLETAAIGDETSGQKEPAAGWGDVPNSAGAEPVISSSDEARAQPLDCCTEATVATSCDGAHVHRPDALDDQVTESHAESDSSMSDTTETEPESPKSEGSKPDSPNPESPSPESPIADSPNQESSNPDSPSSDSSIPDSLSDEKTTEELAAIEENTAGSVTDTADTCSMHVDEAEPTAPVDTTADKPVSHSDTQTATVSATQPSVTATTEHLLN